MPTKGDPLKVGDRVSVPAWRFDEAEKRKEDRWSYQYFGPTKWRTARCFGVLSASKGKGRWEVSWTDAIWAGAKDIIRRDYIRLEPDCPPGEDRDSVAEAVQHVAASSSDDANAEDGDEGSTVSDDVEDEPDEEAEADNEEVDEQEAAPDNTQVNEVEDVTEENDNWALCAQDDEGDHASGAREEEEESDDEKEGETTGEGAGDAMEEWDEDQVHEKDEQRERELTGEEEGLLPPHKEERGKPPRKAHSPAEPTAVPNCAACGRSFPSLPSRNAHTRWCGRAKTVWSGGRRQGAASTAAIAANKLADILCLTDTSADTASEESHESRSSRSSRASRASRSSIGTDHASAGGGEERGSDGEPMVARPVIKTAAQVAAQMAANRRAAEAPAPAAPDVLASMAAAATAAAHATALLAGNSPARAVSQPPQVLAPVLATVLAPHAGALPQMVPLKASQVLPPAFFAPAPAPPARSPLAGAGGAGDQSGAARRGVACTVASASEAPAWPSGARPPRPRFNLHAFPRSARRVARLAATAPPAGAPPDPWGAIAGGGGGGGGKPAKDRQGSGGSGARRGPKVGGGESQGGERGASGANVQPKAAPTVPLPQHESGGGGGRAAPPRASNRGRIRDYLSADRPDLSTEFAAALVRQSARVAKAGRHLHTRCRPSRSRPRSGAEGDG